MKKHTLRSLESSSDFKELQKATGGTLLSIINSLCSFLYHKSPVIKWNAVTAMGSAVSCLAESDMESARNIIRRLMWNLNDESGGIGWGSPEAMGEIISGSDFLVNEFLPILISYLREDGNYQENEIMQRGVLWGIGRVCLVYPDEVLSYKKYFLPYLNSVDPGVRGLSAWIIGLLRVEEAAQTLEKLLDDESEFETFMNNGVVTKSVWEFAREALEKIISR